MKKFSVLTATVVISMASAGIAFANAGHGHGDNTEKTGPAAAMQGGHDMMRMMMQMHSGMMGGDDMGHMGMMNQNMMRMMMGAGATPGMAGPMGSMMSMLDADGDGTVTPEEALGQLQAMHEGFDGNGDGSLSIEEFEALHSSMIREAMVDRFQHLDADGDGAVTASEMTAPADRMQRMKMAPGAMTPGTMMDGSGENTENN